MSFDNTLPRQIIMAAASDAQQTGWFESVETNEPKSAPHTDKHYALWVMSANPVTSSSIISTSMRIELAGRFYSDMLQEPQGEIDANLMAIGWDLMERYSSGFTLGGLIRDVDLLGSEGAPLSIRFGYVTIDKRLYRIADLTIPLIVNDVFDQAV